jgi:energy-coupling factor transport system substrate-specific component
VLLALASVLGLVAFGWPFLVHADGAENLAHAGDAPWIFVMLLPLLLAIVLAELAEGVLDTKAVALLGVLAACGTALRLPSGVTGFEPVFFLLIPAGRVLGKGFGFVLGALTLFASALLTGGVGPWLPFQMIGAAWVGFGAGCLPRASGRRELALLATYGFVAGLAYGFLLNLWFWPIGSSAGSQVSFVEGAGFAGSLRRYWAFYLTTSLVGPARAVAARCSSGRRSARALAPGLQGRLRRIITFAPAAAARPVVCRAPGAPGTWHQAPRPTTRAGVGAGKWAGVTPGRAKGEVPVVRGE